MLSRTRTMGSAIMPSRMPPTLMRVDITTMIMMPP